MKSSVVQVRENAGNHLQLVSLMRDLYFLMKPTVGMLILVTVIPGFFLGIDPLAPTASVVITALLGTFLCSGSAAVFNQVIDVDIDHKMTRTKDRPVVSERLSRKVALGWGVATGIIGLALLAFGAHPLAAAIAVFANAFYVLVYSKYLKKRTTQNIVIGGIAGAIGPLIGCAAVNGSISLSAWILAGVIFFWTPSHFWALSLKYKDDYAKAGIPMLPVVKGDAYTRKAVWLYALTLWPVILLQVFTEISDVTIGIQLLFTLWYTVSCWNLYRSQSNANAMAVFYKSCFYLFFVFICATFDGLYRVSL